MKAFNMSFASQAKKACQNPVVKTNETLKGGIGNKPLDPLQKKNLARLERKRFLEQQAQNKLRLEQKEKMKEFKKSKQR